MLLSQRTSGLTHLHEIEDGQQARAKIVKKVLDRDAEDHQRIKMLVSCEDDKIEELMDCNELCDVVADQHKEKAAGETDVCAFREVLEHQGPSTPTDAQHKGSACDVKVRHLGTVEFDDCFG